MSAATYEAPLLAGEVREGQKTYRAGIAHSERERRGKHLHLPGIAPMGEDLRAFARGRARISRAGRIAPQSILPNDAPPRAALHLVSRHEPGAIPVALHFILPPNFHAAWAKGEVMVCVEAEFNGRRVMLDALPRAQRLVCDEGDLAIVEYLSDSLGRAAAGMNMLSASAFLDLLPILRGHPRLSFGKGKAFRVSPEIYRPYFILRRAGEGFEVIAQSGADEMFLVAGSSAWLLRGQDFLEIGNHLPLRLTNALREPVRIKGERADEFFALELPLWREVAEIELPGGVSLPVVEEGQPLFSLRLEGSLQRLHATLRCSYGDRPPLGPTSDPENLFAFRDATDANRLLVRNLGAENEAVARLERTGFACTVDGYEIRDARRVVRFFAFDFPALPPEWEISVAPRLEKASHELEPVAPTIEIVRSGEDWFELKYSVATGAGEGIPLGRGATPVALRPDPNPPNER